jgi:hypothetical protein
LDALYRRLWRLGDLRYLSLRCAATSGFGFAPSATIVLPNLIAGDRGKPSAETVFRPVPTEVRQVNRHRGKHLLDHIGCIFGSEV